VRCLFADSGGSIARDVEARMTFAWSASAESLLPGSYTERITLTIEVKH
jgi:hypothetical protein